MTPHKFRAGGLLMVSNCMLLSCFPSDVCFWEGGGPSGLARLIGTEGASLEGDRKNTKGEGVLTSGVADCSAWNRVKKAMEST
jgi:hypothetical protein